MYRLPLSSNSKKDVLLSQYGDVLRSTYDVLGANVKLYVEIHCHDGKA